jgi:hypothetical protein
MSAIKGSTTRSGLATTHPRTGQSAIDPIAAIPKSSLVEESNHLSEVVDVPTREHSLPGDLQVLLKIAMVATIVARSAPAAIGLSYIREGREAQRLKGGAPGAQWRGSSYLCWRNILAERNG